MFLFLKIRLYLKKNLSNYRYLHSLRVAKEAERLAKHYGASKKDAYMAGLLHDIAKEYDYDKNKYIINKYKLSMDLLNSSKICHAEIGAIVSKELYNVSDDVISAIKYHTIGNINMNLLDKIIFVADKIETLKKYPGIEKERFWAYKDLDKALLKCIQNSKKVLGDKDKSLHEETEKLLEFLENKIKD